MNCAWRLVLTSYGLKIFLGVCILYNVWWKKRKREAEYLFEREEEREYVREKYRSGEAKIWSFWSWPKQHSIDGGHEWRGMVTTHGVGCNPLELLLAQNAFSFLSLFLFVFLCTIMYCVNNPPFHVIWFWRTTIWLPN